MILGTYRPVEMLAGEHPRLLASQDNREEARTRFGKIYNCFTEGFDAAGLKDAKALLDELN